jgi:hypothetical protein
MLQIGFITTYKEHFLRPTFDSFITPLEGFTDQLMSFFPIFNQTNIPKNVLQKLKFHL